MTHRVRPASRRGSDTVEFEHEGKRYIGTYSCDDDGRVLEIFLNGNKLGSESDSNARDAAVAVSLALQYGCPLQVLQHAMARSPSGAALGPVTHMLDLVARITNDHLHVVEPAAPAPA